MTFSSATLTLDGQGNPNAVWIFKVGTGGSGALTGTNFYTAPVIQPVDRRPSARVHETYEMPYLR
ncbi:hypothetical protein [Paraburkholderia phytofirmans]|uniref:hypothetical protein n=1 Tax=Paraburkholderia phytofirmans TaxID=261302 RepID=UPI003B589BD5